MICGNKNCSHYNKEVGGNRYCPFCGWNFNDNDFKTPEPKPPKPPKTPIKPQFWKYVSIITGIALIIFIAAYIQSRNQNIVASSDVVKEKDEEYDEPIDSEYDELTDGNELTTDNNTSTSENQYDDKSDDVGLVAKADVIQEDDRITRLSEGYGLDESDGVHTWSNGALLKDRQIQYSMDRLVVGEDYATYLHRIGWNYQNSSLAYDTYELLIYEYDSNNRAKGETKVLFTKNHEDAEIQLNTSKEEYDTYSKANSWGYSADSSVKAIDNLVVSLNYNLFLERGKTHKVQTVFYYWNDMGSGKAILADGYSGDDLRKAIEDTNNGKTDFDFMKWQNDGYVKIKPSAQDLIE